MQTFFFFFFLHNLTDPLPSFLLISRNTSYYRVKWGMKWQLINEYSVICWCLNSVNSGRTDSGRPRYWHYSIRVCLYSVQRAHCHFTGNLNMWLSQLFHLKFLLLSLTPYGGLNIICSWFFWMSLTQTKGNLQRFAALTHGVGAEGW